MLEIIFKIIAFYFILIAFLGGAMVSIWFSLDVLPRAQWRTHMIIGALWLITLPMMLIFIVSRALFCKEKY